MLAQRRREAGIRQEGLHGFRGLGQDVLIRVALEERLVEFVKCVWQVLDASQPQERDFKSIDEPERKTV